MNGFSLVMKILMLSIWPSVWKVPQSNLIAVVKLKFERMFVFGFFFQFLCHMPQRNWIFIYYCLWQWVTATKKICLSHWATATNRFFVGCTESLWETKFIYVPQKRPKNATLFGTFCHVWHFLLLFGILYALFRIFF